MTTTKLTALVALAAATLTAACGSSEKGEATAAAGQPMSAEEKIVDLGSGETVGTTPDAAPIAVVEGVDDGMSAQLLRLQRVGKVVTATLRLVNDSNETFDPDLESEDGTYDSADGLRLVDEINGREHFPLESPGGGCLCSTDIGYLEPGESAGISAKFPAPPEDVTQVSLHVPEFQSFDAVPLGQ